MAILMTDFFEIDVSLTKGEIARYNFHHIRWILVLDLFGLAGVIAMTYFSIFDPSPATRELCGSLLIWAVVLLAAGLSQPFILFLQIYVLKNPAMLALTAHRVYKFDSDFIYIESDGKSALTAWSDVRAIKDIGRLILIFTGRKLAYVIPKRSLWSPEQLESFMRFLTEKAGK